MDKEEQNQLQRQQVFEIIPNIAQQDQAAHEEDNESKHHVVPDSEQTNFPLVNAEEQEITKTATDHKQNSGAAAAQEPVHVLKEQTKDPHPSTATDETPITLTQAQLLKEQPLGLSLVTPNPEEGAAQAIDLQLNDRPPEAQLPETSITAAASLSKTLAEDEQVELVKEAIREPELHDATLMVVSDVTPVAEASEETRHAEPAPQVEKKGLQSTETVNQSADLKPEAGLPEVQAAGLQLPDTSDAAATGEVENKETEFVKEDIKEFEFPDSSSLVVAPVVDAELIPGTRITETTQVSGMHTEREKAPDELIPAESTGAESEVSEALPEEKKKKKRALGDHLAEEKVNDSIKGKAKKQASVDEKPETELSKEEQVLASATGPKESSQISSRDCNITSDTATAADEKKEVADAPGGVTATEAAPEGDGEEKVAQKESVAAWEAAKEEVVNKSTSRSSNTILSKVKHQIVKVKKAIVKRAPGAKNMPVENKEDIKVK